MRLRACTAVFVGAVLLFAFAGTAAAQDRPASASAKKRVTALVGTPGAVKTPLGAQAMASTGCAEQQFRVSARNILGWRLFTYVRWVYWCWNGSYLTYVGTRPWGEVHIPGWSYKGTIGSWSIGGRGYTYYRVWSQGHFCLVEYFSCVQNSYPWIDVTVYPGGGWRWSYGG